MRKLFCQQMMSLDGFMEGPNRELDCLLQARVAKIGAWANARVSRASPRQDPQRLANKLRPTA